jgi:hypothetical protein
LGSDYMFNEDRESSKIKFISLKEHQIWENQFNELNIYPDTTLLLADGKTGNAQRHS